MRQKIVAAILEDYERHGLRDQRHILNNALKRLSDTNLLALAIDLGIDTDAVLSETVPS